MFEKERHKLVLNRDEMSRAREDVVYLALVVDPEDEEDLVRIAHLNTDLPDKLRSFLSEFRLRESNGVCIVSGYEVRDVNIGPTPTHWRASDRRLTRAEELYLHLCGSMLGDAFAWSHQRDGLICQDLVPVESDRQSMLGTGSEIDLVWHTEDARYDARGDYIGLMCLRNPDEVPTTFCDVATIKDQLGPKDIEELMKEQYIFKADPSHPADKEQVVRSVLFGDPGDPYIRFDPYSMVEPVAQDGYSVAAIDAYHRLAELISDNMTGYALKPGEILFVDNYRVVHGRSAYSPRFDGTDRWLKRINLTRDLRKSRSMRARPEGRVIY